MVEDYITRYVTKAGLKRDILNYEKKPLNIDDLVIHPFFSDLQTAIFCGQVLFNKRYNKKKYNIVLTWPGLAGIFSGADEVWGLNPDYAYKAFHYQSNGIDNRSANYKIMMRSLNENFINVNDCSKYFDVYKNRLLDSFRNAEAFKLSSFEIQPINNLQYFKSGIKKAVVFIPWSNYKKLSDSEVNYISMDPAIYVELVKRLNYFGYHVYCVQNDWTFDLSSFINNPEIIYVKENSIAKIISYIHHVGAFFDYFADFQIMGHLAQVPTFSIYERNFYNFANKDLEKYICNFTNINSTMFSFAYFARNDAGLNFNVINSIIDKFDDFYESHAKNYVKRTIKEKDVDLKKYLKKRVLRYKPHFISNVMRQKRVENEKANVGVEAKDLHYNASRDEIDRNFRNLMAAFRQQCNKAGILKEIKKREFYETPSQIDRKKRREKESMLLKLKMKESFIEIPKAKSKTKPKRKTNGR